jgi:hypothetical protein
MEFTGKFAKEVSTLVIDTLNKVFAEKGYDITVTNGGGNYAPLEFKLKLKLALSNADGTTQAHSDYTRYADIYNLPLEMLGSTFKYNGKFFTVTGLLPNRRKNDIQIENANGKTFIAPHESVIRAYKLHTAKAQFDDNPIPAVTI